MRSPRRIAGRHGVRGRVVAVLVLAVAIGASSAIGALDAVGTTGGARAEAPDLILENGRFITMDDRRPSARAICDLLQPCFLSAASIYLSSGESWRYVMT